MSDAAVGAGREIRIRVGLFADLRKYASPGSRRTEEHTLPAGATHPRR